MPRLGYLAIGVFATLSSSVAAICGGSKFAFGISSVVQTENVHGTFNDWHLFSSKCAHRGIQKTNAKKDHCDSKVVPNRNTGSPYETGGHIICDKDGAIILWYFFADDYFFKRPLPIPDRHAGYGGASRDEDQIVPTLMRCLPNDEAEIDECPLEGSDKNVGIEYCCKDLGIPIPQINCPADTSADENQDFPAIAVKGLQGDLEA